MPASEPDASEHQAVVAALADVRTYGDVAPVEHIQTHISHVFLVGPHVYKLMKPVTFSFLDFGTRDQRRRLCEEEVRLNRRLAPDVYLGVLPVTVDGDGRIRFGGDGRVLDHVVWMRPLPAARLLPALLHAGAADDAMMEGSPTGSSLSTPTRRAVPTWPRTPTRSGSSPTSPRKSRSSAWTSSAGTIPP